MREAIIAQMCYFPRSVEAVAESIKSAMPEVAISVIEDRIHEAIGNYIEGCKCVTITGRAMLVWRMP